MPNTSLKVSYYDLTVPFLLISEYFENTFGFKPTPEQIICFSIYTTEVKTARQAKKNITLRTLQKKEVDVPKFIFDHFEEIHLKNPSISDKATLLTLILISRSQSMPQSVKHPEYVFNLNDKINTSRGGCGKSA